LLSENLKSGANFSCNCQAARDALRQVNDTLNTIDEALGSARDIVEWTPVDFDVLCPNIQEDRQQEILGTDLRNLTSLITGEFNEVSTAVEKNITSIDRMLRKIENGFLHFENSLARIEDFMWIIPGLLFAVSMLASGSMLGVLLAWREKSGRCIQHAMSYGALPVLMLVTVACWLLVISSAFGTMMTSGKASIGEVKVISV
jgi:hypothetical protein